MVMIQDEPAAFQHGEGVLRHLHTPQFWCVQDVDGIADKGFFVLAQMPVMLLLLQRVEKTCGNPVRVCLRNPCALCQLLRNTEINQTTLIDGVGLIAQQKLSIKAKLLLQVDGLCSTDIQRCQQGNDLPGTACLHIGIANQLAALLADPRHLGDPVRLPIQNVQRVIPKLIVDLCGQFLPDAFNEAGGKIRNNAFLTRRNDLLIRLHFKLKSIAWVFTPVSLHIHLHALHSREVVTNHLD